jgi:hypothetical protein
MKLTLRKANALQLLINEQIGATNPNPQVAISKYDDPLLGVKFAQTKFVEALEKKQDLLRILYVIRKKVSAVSQAAGIPDLLADVASIDKLTALLKPLAESTQILPSNEVLIAAQEDLKKEQASNSYSRRDAFGAGILPTTWIEEFKAQVSALRKQKQNKSDKLLELNIQNEIELSDAEQGVLKKYDLI